MSEEQSLSVYDVSQGVDDLFKQFGVWATFKAMLIVSWQRRQNRVHVSELPDYLRRDIGLPANKRIESPPLITPWHPRF